MSIFSKTLSLLLPDSARDRRGHIAAINHSQQVQVVAVAKQQQRHMLVYGLRLRGGRVAAAAVSVTSIVVVVVVAVAVRGATAAAVIVAAVARPNVRILLDLHEVGHVIEQIVFRVNCCCLFVFVS